VDGVSLALNSGDTLGIVGESGCGKTMLALSIMNLIPTNGKIINGEILFAGQDLLKLSAEEMRQKRGSEIAMVFQEPMTSLNPVIKVGEQIAEAIRLHQKLPPQEALSLSIDQLREVGINDPEKTCAGISPSAKRWYAPESNDCHGDVVSSPIAACR